MRKLLLVCVALLCAIALLTSALAEEGEKGYEEKKAPVATDALALRFYEATPNVPYLGMGAYSQFMKEQPLTLRDNGDGTYALVNPIGEELIYDEAAGQMTIADWGRFFDMPLPLENAALGWKDTTLPCVRMVDVAYEGEPEPVTLDFAKYGIQVYVDESDIYLPVSTLNNIMTDIALNHMLYNGENLYTGRLNIDGSAPAGFFDSDMYLSRSKGEARPDDIVQQSYADLCFDFDHFFGHPGVAVLDEAIAEKGLDQALIDLGEEGVALREGLLSSDLYTYLSSVAKLFYVYLADGHTVNLSLTALNYSSLADSSPMFSTKLSLKALVDMLDSQVILRQLVTMLIPPQREDIWGSETYREYGSTAIIRLDSFMPDEAAWDRFCSGEGDLPEDDLGNVIAGLRKASENPEIENVIFDLTCNGGGSPDVMMTILAMTTGQDQLYGLQKLTGQKLTFTFEVDANFDGVYDEKDQDVRYDFNYGVLVSRYAFSCGNLFPFIAQEGGMVVIGEPTSGGSCCVQMGTDAESFFYMMSSGQWQLTDDQSNSVEGGCIVDLPIDAPTSFVYSALSAYLGSDETVLDYSAYYDDAMLDQMMNDWFQSEAEALDAA